MFTLSQHHIGIVFAIITACGLGSITTQAKIFYADGGNALTLMLARFFASTLVFGLLLLLRGQKFGVANAQRTPLMLRAVNLATGAESWSREIRDTRYRGPYPT